MAEYIKREKVLSNLSKLSSGGSILPDDENGWDDAISEAMSIVEKAPTADVRPERHGEWKGYTTSAFHGFDDFGEPIYRDVNVWVCSECNRRSVVKERFCPNCGAKMDGKDGE